MLNETNRDEVTREIIGWLRDALELADLAELVAP